MMIKPLPLSQRRHRRRRPSVRVMLLLMAFVACWCCTAVSAVPAVVDDEDAAEPEQQEKISSSSAKIAATSANTSTTSSEEASSPSAIVMLVPSHEDTRISINAMFQSSPIDAKSKDYWLYMAGSYIGDGFNSDWETGGATFPPSSGYMSGFIVCKPPASWSGKTNTHVPWAYKLEPSSKDLTASITLTDMVPIHITTKPATNSKSTITKLDSIIIAGILSKADDLKIILPSTKHAVKLQNNKNLAENFGIDSEDYENMYVAKLDADGKFLWRFVVPIIRVMEGIPANFIKLAVDTEDNNNVIVAGSFLGDFKTPGKTLVSTDNSVDVFLLKLDVKDGKILSATSSFFPSPAVTHISPPESEPKLGPAPMTIHHVSSLTTACNSTNSKKDTEVIVSGVSYSLLPASTSPDKPATAQDLRGHLVRVSLQSSQAKQSKVERRDQISKHQLSNDKIDQAAVKKVEFGEADDEMNDKDSPPPIPMDVEGPFDDDMPPTINGDDMKKSDNIPLEEGFDIENMDGPNVPLVKHVDKNPKKESSRSSSGTSLTSTSGSSSTSSVSSTTASSSSSISGTASANSSSSILADGESSDEVSNKSSSTSATKSSLSSISTSSTEGSSSASPSASSIVLKIIDSNGTAPHTLVSSLLLGSFDIGLPQPTKPKMPLIDHRRAPITFTKTTWAVIHPMDAFKLLPEVPQTSECIGYVFAGVAHSQSKAAWKLLKNGSDDWSVLSFVSFVTESLEHAHWTLPLPVATRAHSTPGLAFAATRNSSLPDLIIAGDAGSDMLKFNATRSLGSDKSSKFKLMVDLQSGKVKSAESLAKDEPPSDDKTPPSQFSFAMSLSNEPLIAMRQVLSEKGSSGAWIGQVVGGDKNAKGKELSSQTQTATTATSSSKLSTKSPSSSTGSSKSSISPTEEEANIPTKALTPTELDGELPEQAAEDQWPTPTETPTPPAKETLVIGGDKEVEAPSFPEDGPFNDFDEVSESKQFGVTIQAVIFVVGVCIGLFVYTRSTGNQARPVALPDSGNNGGLLATIKNFFSVLNPSTAQTTDNSRGNYSPMYGDLRDDGHDDEEIGMEELPPLSSNAAYRIPLSTEDDSRPVIGALTSARTRNSFERQRSDVVITESARDESAIGMQTHVAADGWDDWDDDQNDQDSVETGDSKGKAAATGTAASGDSWDW